MARGRPRKNKIDGPKPTPIELNEDQKRALFFHHMERFRETKTAVDAAMAEHKKAIAEASQEGISKIKLKVGLTLESERGEVKAKQEVLDTIEVARYYGLQLGLFDQQPDRRPVSERAFEEGKVAGMNGKSTNSSYAPASNEHQAFMDGWHEGNVARNSILNRAMPRTAAEAAAEANAATVAKDQANGATLAAKPAEPSDSMGDALADAPPAENGHANGNGNGALPTGSDQQPDDDPLAIPANMRRVAQAPETVQ